MRSADRGSDSTFQMVDITRRILARGSTSTAVCETAGSFLFQALSFSPPFLSSSSLRPCLCLLPQLPNNNKNNCPYIGGLPGQSLFSSCFHLHILNFKYFLSLFHFPKISCSFLPFQEKSSLHVVMIILHFLIFALLQHYLTLLPSSFSISWNIQLCGKLFGHIFAVVPLTTQQKCADNQPQRQ